MAIFFWSNKERERDKYVSAYPCCRCHSFEYFLLLPPHPTCVCVCVCVTFPLNADPLKHSQGWYSRTHTQLTHTHTTHAHRLFFSDEVWKRARFEKKMTRVTHKNVTFYNTQLSLYIWHTHFLWCPATKKQRKPGTKKKKKKKKNGEG